MTGQFSLLRPLLRLASLGTHRPPKDTRLAADAVKAKTSTLQALEQKRATIPVAGSPSIPFYRGPAAAVAEFKTTGTRVGRRSFQAASPSSRRSSQSVQIRNFHLETAKRVIPHPSKVHSGGEDAAFCTDRYLGVSDGVGGWGEYGIDAGLFARELMDHVQQTLRAYHQHEVEQGKEGGKEGGSTTPDPLDVLREAYARTRSIGTATCSLVFLDTQRESIRGINLGDSGYIVYRPSTDEVIMRSKSQQHQHNYPYQLGTGSSDIPDDADRQEVAANEGDIIVLATDGLWDNMFETQLLNLLRSSESVTSAADAVASTAYRFSTDGEWISPFAQKEKAYLLEQHNADARCMNDTQFVGGKPDDISVVVARIK